MSNDPFHKVLNYHTPERSRERPLLETMRLWRSIGIWSLVGVLFGAVVPIIGAVALVSLLVASVMTFVYMTRLAALEVSAGYAIRHLLLGLLLLPIFGIGLMIVPVIVESDLVKWRDRENGIETEP